MTVSDRWESREERERREQLEWEADRRARRAARPSPTANRRAKIEARLETLRRDRALLVKVRAEVEAEQAELGPAPEQYNERMRWLNRAQALNATLAQIDDGAARMSEGEIFERLLKRGKTPPSLGLLGIERQVEELEAELATLGA